VSGTIGLLGPEPAYRFVRESPYDYAEVDSADDVIEALERINDTPGEYGRFRAQGTRRAAAYSQDAITQRWADLLAGPVTAAFRRYERTPKALRTTRHAIDVLAQRTDFEIHRRRQRSRKI